MSTVKSTMHLSEIFVPLIESYLDCAENALDSDRQLDSLYELGECHGLIHAFENTAYIRNKTCEVRNEIDRLRGRCMNLKIRYHEKFD